MPVIVIGNISVGGVGKTPVVIALAKYLTQKGLKPGIISRGYQGDSTEYPLVVNADSDPKQAGDEPVLLAALSHCPVVVDPNRVNAANRLSSEFDVDIILSDDGLQHYSLRRDVEIAVVDGARGFGNSRCIPAGPLREPVSRLNSVDWVLINGGYFDYKPGYRFCLNTLAVVSMDGRPAAIHSKTVHAVAAIGNPQRFFNSLRALGFEVIEHAFPDHHFFSSDNFSMKDDLPIIMTAKDAVKCRSISLKNGYYLPVEAELPHDFLTQFEQRLSTLGLLPSQD